MKKLVYILLCGAMVLACDDVVGVKDISNQFVVVMAPTEDAQLTTNNVTFNWQTVEEATQYRIQIATPDFESASQILTDSLAVGTNFNKVLDSGEYQWRIRAENSEYHTAYSTQSFSVFTEPNDISNKQVVLLAPADGVTFTDVNTINFSWEAVLDADQYVIQIATPNFQNALEVITDQTLNNTQFSASNLEANAYEWRVKAINTSSETLYSKYSFTVEE
ncbi:MAG: hypothetical protein ACK5M1_06510 [Xanthomarina gelatinilytica]|uniref:hypothetical protein n=1 Tax=Xanthomarina gelatinilytica TaxID=1137281 RepID=UPI003A8655F4